MSNKGQASKATSVNCPICGRIVREENINYHLDNDCPGQNARATPASKTTSKAPVAPVFNSAKKPSNVTVEGSFHIGSSLATKREHPEAGGASVPRATKRSKGTVTSRSQAAAPLAERLRPQELEDFIGQKHLTGSDSLLMNLMRGGSTGSIIFWGPPGCGKTTLARLMARKSGAVFKEISATEAGIGDVRAIVEEAKGTLMLQNRRTVLFLDEVHRFNRAQQDIFLPYIEQGQIQLIGATTENPSFKINSALLSRCRVFVLERLSDDDVSEIIDKAVHRVLAGLNEVTDSAAEASTSSATALSQESNQSTLISSQPSISAVSFPSYPQLTERVKKSIISLSLGDARTALSLLELVLSSPQDIPEAKLLDSLRRSVSTSYDRTGDDRYDLISALHKSVRGSDGSAAMYWLARMLETGEDPMYIARRMTVCASEDIGLADSHALPLAIATMQACQMIGMPECRINLAHLVAYLAEAPKSTRSYEAYKRAAAAAKSDPTLAVPLVIRNAPTKLMKNLGYSEGYRYNPDYAHPVTNDYLPPQFRDEVFLRKEGDLSGKEWDEEALHRWEVDMNGGKAWEGRGTSFQDLSDNDSPKEGV
ncbi:P-loop containing nucleoside triphosphate hydrolase protein [Gloeophyllum trabeum ATCC 11539]|uniref:p-loop containing nucleoside triphosphate hydrolase protein n=1 Tax=Gloeophyllum trabeum (strain ATCC 11539 / FP-39264 / Madison 617) TaxID=670483 RepID=S7RRY8_GLOTA|nr:P-loop containing nucleoside triphosphate hydrolase protein [Gloeophyllum trabeum ATCC 11539]EPQ57405.1 P-loop containing nucleoside triphosphate hydrolase protein [Gloeophyllum trabeum ATCC 11539]